MNKKLLYCGLLLLSTSSLHANSCEGVPTGKLVTDFPLNVGKTATLGMQADGQSIVARFTKTKEDNVEVNAVSFERFQCNGKKDSNFGENGIVKVDIHPLEPRRMIHLTKEGKILVAGSDGVRLRRYTEDGDLDNTFGSEGKVEGAFTIKDDRELKNKTTALKVQSNGKILVAGNATRSLPPYNILYFVARFNADGSVDKSFASNGKIFDGESEKDAPELLVENVLSDGEGNVYLVGSGLSTGKKALVLHKFDKNGMRVKGPVAYVLPEADSTLKISNVLLNNDTDLIFYGEKTDNETQLTSLMLLKANTNLEFDKNFKFEPKRGLASGHYEANSIGALSDGFVLTSSYNEEAKEEEMQIIKVNTSGKEVIRLSEKRSQSLSEVPITLLEQKNGKYSLLGASNTAFNPQGLEYILLKFAP